jgi:glyoxylase-like metal-dependent hydrolase (beta-lactamase superfamily II)
MLGDVSQLADNLWFIQGEMPPDATKAPDPCNVVIYKPGTNLYLIDSSCGAAMRESIRRTLVAAGPVDCFTLIQTHNHLDHICNNDLLGAVEAKERKHCVLAAGVSPATLDAPSYFAEQFDKMDEVYDPFSGYQAHRLTYFFAALLRDVGGLFVGRRRVLRFLFGTLFKKFEPVNASVATMTALEELPRRELNHAGVTWSGWTLGGGEVEVLEGRGHSDDEVFVYLPEHRLLALGDVTFPLFPTWDNSHRDRIVDCLRRSLAMVRAGQVNVLADGHGARCFIGKADIEALLQRTLDDHLEYEDVLRDILAREDGLTPGELYARFKRDPRPVVARYLALEFPHTPASLQNVMVTTLLQLGYEARGPRRHQRFHRQQGV